MPDNFRHSLIAFNKQGTHIILHGADCTQVKNMVFSIGDDATQEFMPHHLIFPVTVNEQNAVPSKKTLQHYFQQRRICKDITKSIDK